MRKRLILFYNHELSIYYINTGLEILGIEDTATL